jgi:hypothetical protein
MKENFSFKNNRIDQVEYSFRDASVPPPFHRSYKITVKSDSVYIVVNSYETIITDTNFVSSPEKLNKIIMLLDEGKVRNEKLPDNDGYTGGTGENIVCKNNDTIIFSGYVYHCADMDSGNLAGNYSLAVKAMAALIPDLEGLLKRQ